MTHSSKIAIIGAGPSGITALKNLATNGFDVTCFEMNDQIGGNWVYKDKTGHSMYILCCCIGWANLKNRNQSLWKKFCHSEPVKVSLDN